MPIVKTERGSSWDLVTRGILLAFSATDANEEKGGKLI
jgi:hypothetical protein